ncbi:MULTISPECIES: CbaC protein [Natrialba]|uniref:CbaC protein n=1 Tax=Natrialba swarupiae TaxID=2448032 RepID=A0A5D5AQE4_9EURY|nr:MULTISPECIES: CbaC protein [Natrialba]MWV39041.1 CbaC protein [Natrialba sp. INN-245]TYT61261.1 CbaC protein [Natrialba swarupiae]
MRTSPAKLLILIAILLVIVVELRTVLAFFDVELTVLQGIAVGIVGIALLLVWAFSPLFSESDQ